MTVSHSITALILPQQTSVCTPQPSLPSSFIMTHTHQHHITLVFQSPFVAFVTYCMCTSAHTHAPAHSPPTGPIPLPAGAHWLLTPATPMQTSLCGIISCSITQGDRAAGPQTKDDILLSHLALHYRNTKHLLAPVHCSPSTTTGSLLLFRRRFGFQVVLLLPVDTGQRMTYNQFVQLGSLA